MRLSSRLSHSFSQTASITMASAFSSSEAEVLERTIDAPSSVASGGPFELEIDATANHILKRGYRRISLQFPDALLQHASAAVAGLRAALAQQQPAVEIFVLGDTSFDGFQVDFVSAQHLAADFVVHYGPVDLEAEGPLPVRFVLGRRPLNVHSLSAAVRANVAAASSAAADGDSDSRRLLVVPSLPYAHLAEELSAALLSAGCQSALVCGAEIEREAAREDDDAAAPAAAATTAAAAAAAAPMMLARGRLLGRTLPEALHEDELARCDLLYVGGDDQTLSNLVMLLRDATVYLHDPGDAAADADGAAEGAAERGGEGGGSGLAITTLALQTSRRLMRRYFLVQKAREAEVVGILIGTLSASQRKPMLASLKHLIKQVTASLHCQHPLRTTLTFHIRS